MSLSKIIISFLVIFRFLIACSDEKNPNREDLRKDQITVIYLDFWSSGCPPCIKQFEHSNRIKVLYGDKKLVQIYISIEPNRKIWEKACNKYDLKDESYYVGNRFTSKQLEKINIKYFPHYVLYDKNGNLVIESAPRPDNKDLLKLLDKYLAEK